MATNQKKTKRSKEETMQESKPKVSHSDYVKVWKEFIEFTGKGNTKPEEINFIQFIDHKKNNHNYAKSTIYKTYSMLNVCYAQKYGEKLRQFPAIKTLINSYDDKIPKQAAVLSLEEIREFICHEFDDHFFLLRQAIIAIAYNGGLGMAEARRIQIEDLVETPDGYSITIGGSKKRQELRLRTFLIPGNTATPFKRRIDQYLEKLRQETSITSGPIFRGCHGGKRFVNQLLGKNMIAGTCKEVAKWLGLPNYDRYTGHCLRRSAATCAAGNSADVCMMQKHFGWSSRTAIRYIESVKKNQMVMSEKITGETNEMNNNVASPTSRQAKTLEENDEVAESEVPVPCNASAEDPLKTEEPGVQKVVRETRSKLSLKDPRRHRRNVHLQKKKIECEFCTKSFSSSVLLKHHHLDDHLVQIV